VSLFFFVWGDESSPLPLLRCQLFIVEPAPLLFGRRALLTSSRASTRPVLFSLCGQLDGACVFFFPPKGEPSHTFPFSRRRNRQRQPSLSPSSRDASAGPSRQPFFLLVAESTGLTPFLPFPRGSPQDRGCAVLAFLFFLLNGVFWSQTVVHFFPSFLLRSERTHPPGLLGA